MLLNFWVVVHISVLEEHRECLWILLVFITWDFKIKRAKCILGSSVLFVLKCPNRNTVKIQTTQGLLKWEKNVTSNRIWYCPLTSWVVVLSPELWCCPLTSWVVVLFPYLLSCDEDQPRCLCCPPNQLSKSSSHRRKSTWPCSLFRFD